jgi:hypothetical protein
MCAQSLPRGSPRPSRVCDWFSKTSFNARAPPGALLMCFLFCSTQSSKLVFAILVWPRLSLASLSLRPGQFRLFAPIPQGHFNAETVQHEEFKSAHSFRETRACMKRSGGLIQKCEERRAHRRSAAPRLSTVPVASGHRKPCRVTRGFALQYHVLAKQAFELKAEARRSPA